MRAAALLCLMALSACADPIPSRAGDPDPSSPAAASGACGAAGQSALIGQPVSRFSAQARQGPARIMRPGQPVSLDYNPLRLNVLLDADERIVGVSCG